MNKKNKIIKNYLYNMIYQVISAIAPIITIPYKTRVLSPENIGIHSYVFSVLSYLLILGNVGISLYGQREIAYVKDNDYEKSKLFYELIILRGIILGIVSIIFYMFWGLKSIYKTYYLIILIEIIANMFEITWYYQGIENFKKISIVNSICKIVNIICIFAFIKNDSDLTKYIIITVIFSAIPILILTFLPGKGIKKIKIKELSIMRNIKGCIILFIPQICIQIYTVCDKIMLGNLQNNISEVGYYEYANKVILIIIQIVTSITTVMVPVMSYEFKKKNFKKINEYINKLTNSILFITIPIIFGLIAVSQNLTKVFFGQEFQKISILLKILSISILPIALTGIVEHFLISTKQEKKFTVYILIGTIINLVLNMILIENSASIGVSITTIITEIIVLLIELPILKKMINTKQNIELILKYTLYSVIMYIIVKLIGMISSNLIILILQILTGIIFYILVLSLTKDKIFYEITRKIIYKKK